MCDCSKWVSQVAQMVKNLSAMQETQVHSVDRKDLRRKWPPTPVFLPGKSHGQKSLEGYSPWGHKRVGHNLATKQQHSSFIRTDLS